MSDPVFILLTDPYSLEQHIAIYDDRVAAEYARERSTSPDAEIRAFRTSAPIIELVEGTPVHLVMTREDDGLRIHGVFSSMGDVKRCMMAHITESRCLCTIAWPVQELHTAMRA